MLQKKVYRMLMVLAKSSGAYQNFTKQDPLSLLKVLCVNSFVNQKIKYLQKLTVKTAKQSALVNLNRL